MFTGIVETIGTVAALEPLDSSTSGGGGTSLSISSAAAVLHDARLGDSISINGTCLTVTDISADKDTFKVGVAPETLRRTNLGHLTSIDRADTSGKDVHNARVNLEAACQAATRLGGHIVQGHVDTVATIVDKRPDGNAVVFRLKPRDAGVLKYVVEKGFVALDGASLTITAESDEEAWFEVMLIAYTQEKIVMAGKEVGQEVNVEVDMVGKYVEKSVRGYFEGGRSEQGGRVLEKMVRRIVDERLKEASR